MSNKDSYSSESSRSSESDWEYVDCSAEQSDKSQHHEAQFSDTSVQPNITNNTIIIEKDFEKAILCKEKGNELFREKSYDLCIQEYSQAIALCPIDPIHNEILATFYGNRAAAYYSIYEYIPSVDDCTMALQFNANYVKVLMRRCMSLEKLERYDEALNDAKEISKLESSYPKIEQTIKRLEKLNEEKMAKMKDEALGKLKELGNSILGNFGMSLDNFKMKQDPNTGGWNISMEK